MGCSLTRTRTESQTMVWYFSIYFEPDRKILGNITCKPGGTFIGPRNVTIVVSGKHGRVEISLFCNVIKDVFFIRKIGSPQGLKSHVCQFKWRYVCLSHSSWGHLRIPQYGENMMLSGFLELYLLKISTFLKVLSFGTVSIFENKHYPLFLLREESKEAPI